MTGRFDKDDDPSESEIAKHVSERTKQLEATIAALEREIAGNKKVVERLLYQNNLANNIIDNLPAVVVVLNEQLKYVRWSKNFKLADSLGGDELQYEQVASRAFPDDESRKQAEDILRNLIDSGSASGDVTATMPDGSRRTFSVKAFRISYDGEPAFLCLASDISERKKTEDDLKAAYQTLSYHVTNSPLAFITWDKDMSVKQWSGQAERIFGWTTTEAIGKNLYDPDFRMIYDDDQEFVDGITHSLMHGLVDTNIGINRNLTKQGNVIHCEWYNSVLRDDQQNVITIMSLAHDITERKRAEHELKESYAQIRLLSDHLNNVREEERKFITRELHDELGQYLTVMKMDVSLLIKKCDKSSTNVQRLIGVSDMIDKVANAVRRIALELRPDLLDHIGISAAIAYHAKEIEKQFEIRIVYHEPAEELVLPEPVKTHLFRIVQEALTNVVRHSHAMEVNVDLKKEGSKIKLSISDNGIGFNPHPTDKKTLGVIGMKERAAMIGGKYELSTSPGNGTHIRVTLPLHDNQN
jgi:PAS domain S-box-containing protein